MCEEERRILFILFNMVRKSGKFPDGYGFTLSETVELPFYTIKTGVEKLLRRRVVTNDSSVGVWICDYKIEERALRASFHLSNLGAKRMAETSEIDLEKIQLDTVRKLQNPFSLRVYAFLCYGLPERYDGRMRLPAFDEGLGYRYEATTNAERLFAAEKEIDIYSEFNVNLRMLYNGLEPVGVLIKKRPKPRIK